MTELAKAYEPSAHESELYADWMSSGCFHAEADAPGEPFSIVIPPPNVTGSLHVGHALDNTIQDVLVRRARMQGKNAVWVPGTDHAGIATQMVVEKQLAAEGLTRHDLGREAFLERVWSWREESGGVILDQLKQLGCSCDWEREAFTFDEPRNVAVEKVFIDLYEQGLIYRGNRLINWDPVLNTALSDIEVEHEEVQGELLSFRYPFADDASSGIVVATTRAETMLGDTAIAVHPDDERYAEIIGREVRHPFQDRTIPVIADSYVDPEFGSGAVKITPAHDPNDYAIGQRHDLPMINIMELDATINANGGEGYVGLDRFAARRKVRDDLDAAGLLVKVEPHVHQVGHSSRSKAAIEPMLSDQWFVKVAPLAEKALDSVEQGRVRFEPPRFTKPFVGWLENLHDWCISRQLWWGHRIPAWYSSDGEIKVQSDSPGEGWTQDEDVLDTWFSSQLWPFVVFGWPEKTPDLEKWFPTSVLVTGYDINTFWVSRMLMISEWFLDVSPFEVVHNHGLVRDENGKKMSKSFGNVIDPLDLIAEFGADATRFALLRSSSNGSDVPLARDWVDGEKRFANKLWSMVRFALGVIGDDAPAVVASGLPAASELALEDRWILSRWEHTLATTDAACEAFDWATACRTLRAFAWDDLADWYLESIKPRVYGDDDASREAATRVLATVLDQLLRTLHPLIPFVTETLWRALTGSTGGTASLMLASWPTSIASTDADAEAGFAAVQECVGALNRFRSQNSISPSKRFDVVVTGEHADVIAANVAMVAGLATLSGIEVVAELTDEAGRSTIPFTGGTAQVDLTGLIDVDAEVARLTKELEKAGGEIGRLEGKLGNAGFVANAPEAVVDKERAKLADWQRRRVEIDEQITALRSM